METVTPDLYTEQQVADAQGLLSPCQNLDNNEIVIWSEEEKFTRPQSSHIVVGQRNWQKSELCEKPSGGF